MLIYRSESQILSMCPVLRVVSCPSIMCCVSFLDSDSIFSYFSDDHMGGGDRGITVTSNSGLHYTGHQPGHAQSAMLSQLPQFPAPAQYNGHQVTGQLAQPQVPSVSYHSNYGGQPVAAVAPQQRYVPPRDERVSGDPGGRKSQGLAAAGGKMGSMESLQSQDSVFSLGSTISSNGE